MGRQQLLRFLKIGVTIFMLWYILRNADLASILKTIRNSNYVLIVLALLAFSGYQLVYAYNWRRILAILRKDIRYSGLLRIHMIGLFYNLFLPTSMGGDVAKMYYLSKKVNDRMTTVKSIALLRGVGLLTNLGILAIGLSCADDVFGDVRFGAGVSSGFYLFAGVAAAVSLIAMTPVRQNRFVESLLRRIREYTAAFTTFVLSSRKEMIVVILISVLTQLVIIGENCLIMKALSIHIPFVHVMYIVPLTFFATLLPITISGIGIREGAFVYFLSLYGYSVEDALAFSLVGYLLILILGVTGGVVSVSSEK